MPRSRTITLLLRWLGHGLFGVLLLGFVTTLLVWALASHGAHRRFFTAGRMYETAFGRRPTADEVAVVIEFARRQGERLGVAEGACHSDPRVWTDVAHALVNTKEFIFLK